MPPAPRWLQQAGEDVPAADDWLSPSEQAVLARLRFPKRHEEWRLGRWTAKRAVLSSGSWPCGWPKALAPELPSASGIRHAWQRVEVKAALDGAPEVFLDGRQLPVRISITHRAGLAGCLVAPEHIPVGCDLEVVEPREAAFVEDYFTAGERALVTATPPPGRSLVTTIIWSAKESALKALRVGLRADTREVDVGVPPWPWFTRPGWNALVVRSHGRHRPLSGWWRAESGHLVTVVTTHPTPAPVPLLEVSGEPVGSPRVDSPCASRSCWRES